MTRNPVNITSQNSVIRISIFGGSRPEIFDKIKEYYCTFRPTFCPLLPIFCHFLRAKYFMCHQPYFHWYYIKWKGAEKCGSNCFRIELGKHSFFCRISFSIADHLHSAWLLKYMCFEAGKNLVSLYGVENIVGYSLKWYIILYSFFSVQNVIAFSFIQKTNIVFISAPW